MFPKDKLDTAVKDLIELLLTKPPEILKIGKFIIRKGLEADLYTGLGFEVIAGTLESDDSRHEEGHRLFFPEIAALERTTQESWGVLQEIPLVTAVRPWPVFQLVPN